MIRINCTQCKTQLEIDDAFAGGVCRCQHCGTIQTVPKRLKGNADVGGTAVGVVLPTPKVVEASPKVTYQRAARADPGISSGITAQAAPPARKPATTSPPELEPPPTVATTPPPSIPLLVAVAVILLLLGVVIGMLLKSHHALG